MEKKLLPVIRVWVEKNKKAFWKYEVSSLSHTISIDKFPDPSEKDITISLGSGFLSSEKTQLCSAIKDACAKSGNTGHSHIDIKVEYVNGAVVATVI
ncbi:MAG: hypothetical protein ACRCUT_06280 [Spirochaetota bacterium]